MLKEWDDMKEEIELKQFIKDVSLFIKQCLLKEESIENI